MAPVAAAQEYEVMLVQSVRAPMRDGVPLATDIYLPQGVARAPVILMRTPYRKEAMRQQAFGYARHGYAAVVQDVRGRFGSAGEWVPFVNEGKDGYDTIEWLSRQPWSNGKVGMIGGSYLAWVQWFAAAQHPPHLVTIIPNASPSDPFHNMPYDNGILFLTGTFLWTSVVESGATSNPADLRLLNAVNKRFGALMSSLPVIDLDKAVIGRESRFWREWIAHSSPLDPYWSGTMYLDALKSVDLPVFHQSGWFDGDGIGTELNYLRMTGYGHANQKLTIGPWPHSDVASRGIWGHDFGQQAMIDLPGEYLRWFDYWLKGEDNGILKDPLVNIFIMGDNRWVRSQKYPLPETRMEKLYLASGGHANTSAGDGVLAFTPPKDKQKPDVFVYDPGDPTPDPSFYEPSEADTAARRTADDLRKDAEARRAKVTRERQDILVYTTAPFEAAYTIAGPVSAVIYASSSARDTDWFVHLVEVDEHGSFLPLIGADSGKVRARYRVSMAKPKLLKPGAIVKYEIDLWQTGITIQPGHRLRIELASADFPTYARNLNTGENNETGTRYVKAEQQVLHDSRHKSYVLLPRIP